MEGVSRATPITDIPGDTGNQNQTSAEIMNQMQNLENQDANEFQVQENNKFTQGQERQFQNIQAPPQNQIPEEEYEYTEEYAEEPEKTMGQKLWDSVKGPLFFLVIFVLLSNDFVRTLILGFAGKVFKSPDMVCWADIALRGILGAVLFFIVQKFIK